MRVFSYDERGFFNGEIKAQPNPLEPGKWLLPARSTSVSPPDFSGDEEPKWNGSSWNLVESRASLKQKEKKAEEDAQIAEEAAEEEYQKSRKAAVKQRNIEKNERLAPLHAYRGKRLTAAEVAEVVELMLTLIVPDPIDIPETREEQKDDNIINK
jgi:hypothetical protein